MSGCAEKNNAWDEYYITKNIHLFSVVSETSSNQRVTSLNNNLKELEKELLSKQRELDEGVIEEMPEELALAFKEHRINVYRLHDTILIERRIRQLLLHSDISFAATSLMNSVLNINSFIDYKLNGNIKALPTAIVSAEFDVDPDVLKPAKNFILEIVYELANEIRRHDLSDDSESKDDSIKEINQFHSDLSKRLWSYLDDNGLRTPLFYLIHADMIPDEALGEAEKYLKESVLISHGYDF